MGICKSVTADPTVDALRRFLDGRWAWARDEARQTLQQPLFAPVYDLDIDQHRERVFEQAKTLADTSGPRLLFPKELGGDGEIGAAVTAFETQAMGDLSLLVKTGVQWGLFGGAILHLGTQRHHERYLADVISLRLPGCFAMTETGHGSDVQSIGTTATYDTETDEFVVNTPTDSAVKDYIGSAARDGRMAVVFAQLITGSAKQETQRHGVHALLVPIRELDGSPCAGVSIEDCGHKMGLNGVDNGRLAFHNVRVPRDALLDRYGTVDEEGTYTSPIENETRRFFTMLGTLVQGRVSVSGAALSASKVALTIAIRYALVRTQFHAPDSDDEVTIISDGCCRHWQPPMRFTSRRRSSSRSCMRSFPTRMPTRWPAASSRRLLRASSRPTPGTRRRRSRRAGKHAEVPATCPSTGCRS
jgi:acyl-CoA oxidase